MPLTWPHVFPMVQQPCFQPVYQQVYSTISCNGLIFQRRPWHIWNNSMERSNSLIPLVCLWTIYLKDANFLNQMLTTILMFSAMLSSHNHPMNICQTSSVQGSACIHSTPMVSTGPQPLLDLIPFLSMMMDIYLSVEDCMVGHSDVGDMC